VQPLGRESQAVESIAAQFPADAEGVIVFDGACNLCSRAVRWVMSRDARARFRLAALQSDAGARLAQQFGLDRERIESVWLIMAGRAYFKSDALLAIVSRLDPPWPLLASLRLVPRPLRDHLYDFVARNRYRWFGKRNGCMVPSAEERKRFLA
jgi:predicted DCC family thiol-disulfide oxidoreductase YuxK